MSRRKRNRRASLNDLDPTETKKRKLSKITDHEKLIFKKGYLITKVESVCVPRWRRKKNEILKIKDVVQCLNELSKLTTKEREIIIRNAANCDSICSVWSWDCNCAEIKSLLAMNDGLPSSYSFLSETIKKCDDEDVVSISKQNKIKTDIMKEFANPSERGEKYRPYILTIRLNKDDEFSSFWRNAMDIKYYEGTVESLHNFTADTFLNIYKDFNFFRFQNKVRIKNENEPKWNYKYDYIDCTDDEVLDLLESMKKNKESQTFLLLMFIMTAYFKHFLFDAVKSAVQSAVEADVDDTDTFTELNDDVLSVIMSFMIANHQSLHQVFQDKELIKQLMKEAEDADEGWQNILADIIENDHNLTDLYEPRIKTYHDSEKLNLLNLRMYRKTLNTDKLRKWLKCTVEYDHYEIFETILDEHCQLKISVFKHIFYQIPFKDIKDKEEKWLKCIEHKMIDLRERMNKSECKRFDKLCDEWKLGRDRNMT